MTDPTPASGGPLVLITEPVNESALSWLRERGGVPLLMYEGDEWEPVRSEVQAIVVRAFKVTAEVMDGLPGLRVIAKHGVGVNTIDLVAAAERDILVTNVPGANANSVAEHAVALLVALTRDLVDADKLLRSGRFDERFDLRMMKELTETRLGIVGAGRIGRRIAAICSGGYQCEIAFYDPFVDGDTLPSGSARFDDVADLFTWAENVVVAAPLTDATRGLVSADVLSRLGADGAVVCASRGGIVDEAALADALQDGVVRAAGLDVWDPEPPRPDNPLFSLTGTVFTPHVAFSSDKSMERMGMDSVTQLWALLHGEDAPTVSTNSWG